MYSRDKVTQKIVWKGVFVLSNEAKKWLLKLSFLRDNLFISFAKRVYVCVSGDKKRQFFGKFCEYTKRMIPKFFSHSIWSFLDLLQIVQNSFYWTDKLLCNILHCK